jgi:glycosyltransferase involved in cell wall biosynthesis
VVPQVSVVTAARNIELWIEAAIRSVLHQTFSDFELIIVDDGSTDATADIAGSIADPRLTVLRQKQRGSAAARNAGVAASTARYVGFLDGDDVWAPEKLERQVAVLDAHPEIDLTFSWSRIIDESGASTGHLQRAAPGVTGFDDVFTRDVIGNGSSVVARRSALERVGPFDETLRAAIDFDIWLRVAVLRPENCWCVAEPLTLYRRRTGQVTRNWQLSKAENEKVMQKCYSSARPSAALLNRAEATNYRFYAFCAYEGGECRTAMRLLTRALRFSPQFLLRDPRAWSLAAAAGGKLLLPSWVFERVRAFSRRLVSSS